MSRINHLLVLCAYKESEYLEECLLSLLNQTVKTDIVICTSTPNDFIDKIAAKSPLLSIDGPLVTFTFVPISLAKI